jgi:hypothetical protein
MQWIRSSSSPVAGLEVSHRRSSGRTPTEATFISNYSLSLSLPPSLSFSTQKNLNHCGMQWIRSSSSPATGLEVSHRRSSGRTPTTTPPSGDHQAPAWARGGPQQQHLHQGTRHQHELGEAYASDRMPMLEHNSVSWSQKCTIHFFNI